MLTLELSGQLLQHCFNWNLILQGLLLHGAGLKRVKIEENLIGEVRAGAKIISGLSLNFLSASTEKRGTRLYMYRCNSVLLYSTLCYPFPPTLPCPTVFYPT